MTARYVPTPQERLEDLLDFVSRPEQTVVLDWLAGIDTDRTVIEDVRKRLKASYPKQPRLRTSA